MAERELLNDPRTLYQILGVEKDAMDKEIRVRFCLRARWPPRVASEPHVALACVALRADRVPEEGSQRASGPQPGQPGGSV